jgi:hypothetical protein
MSVTMRPFLTFLLLSTGVASSDALAGGRVELELAVEKRVAITGQQEWLRRLSQAGIENFRIRSARSGDVPNIERRGTEDSPLYVVTGIITPDNMLVVPGTRFRASQMGQLGAWLRDLSELGPPDERSAKSAFGLSSKDFERLQADLSPPLGFNTAGVSRADVIRQAAKGMATRLVADPSLSEPLSRDMVAEDLSALSRGTALAYVLRSPGLCLVPSGESGRVSLSIVKARPDMQIWPIGWEPEKPDRDVKPELYEMRPVNVSGVSVTTVLDAIAKLLEMPILLDHNAMARHGLEPDKVIVQLPSSRSTYSIVLRKILFQGRLKSELRLDDADRPFLWVTSVKPM